MLLLLLLLSLTWSPEDAATTAVIVSNMEP